MVLFTDPITGTTAPVITGTMDTVVDTTATMAEVAMGTGTADTVVGIEGKKKAVITGRFLFLRQEIANQIFYPDEKPCFVSGKMWTGV